MAAQQISVEGILLKKIERNESVIHYHILTEKFGLLLCLKRIPKKTLAKVNPDLFDIAILELDRIKRSEIWIIREYRLKISNHIISNHYKSLVYASEYANFLIDNLRHIESFERIFKLTINAFGYWSKGYLPEVVYIKTVYLMARDEGYPIKQDWIASLSKRKQLVADKIIFQKISIQNVDDSDIDALLQSMKKWLKHNTDFIVKL